MRLIKRLQKLKEKGYLPATLLVFSLCITTAITLYFGLTVRELLQTQFDRSSAVVIRELNTRVQSYSFLLKGIQNLMETEASFSEDEFKSYLKQFVNPAIYPGIVETGYIGTRNYIITYQQHADNYLQNNEEALAKARDTGTFSTSIYMDKRIIVYLPVYSNISRNSVEERRTALQGYAYVVINTNQMVKDILKLQTNIGFQLNTEPYFNSNPDQNELSLMTITRDNNYLFFDRAWPITMTLLPYKELSNHMFFLVIIFIFGVSCSVIVYEVSLRQYKSQKKADSLERQKDEFVAIASHELKTPLTSIKALNQLLAEKLKTESNPLYDSYFRKTDSQIKRMEHLINDLMDVSKIRANKLDYNKDWFDLEATIRTICEDMQEVKKSHQVTVNGHLHQHIFGDKNRISQVLTNLLTNAIKYSPQANLIIVTLKETVKEAIISLQDFGIGIVNENQKKIFDRFFRVSADERKFQGMGIGLFISSEIIRKHGGRIWVKSTKGKGSTFSFSIPLKPIEE
jgi:signal transduction histidine kinase